MGLSCTREASESSEEFLLSSGLLHGSLLGECRELYELRSWGRVGLGCNALAVLQPVLHAQLTCVSRGQASAQQGQACRGENGQTRRMAQGACRPGQGST